MLWILESEAIGHLADGLAVIEDPLLCQVDDQGLNMVLGGFPCFLLDKVAKIVGREIQFFGTVGHRGQSEGLGLVGPEIVVQKAFKPFQDALMHILAGDELAVIETYTVIEQQFYIGSDEAFAVAFRSPRRGRRSSRKGKRQPTFTIQEMYG